MAKGQCIQFLASRLGFKPYRKGWLVHLSPNQQVGVQTLKRGLVMADWLVLLASSQLAGWGSNPKEGAGHC